MSAAWTSSALAQLRRDVSMECTLDLNTAFDGGICQQNMSFNMYTTKSKPREGSTCKDCHAKCFITKNSTAKLWPGAMNRGEL